MEIGIKIRKLREGKKMSQTELAYILGISQSKLCNIESNEDKSIDFILMHKVCQFFEVGFDHFLNFNNTKDDLTKTHHSHTTLHDAFEDSVMNQIHFLIADNRSKEHRIQELLFQIAQMKRDQI
ncbi:helix-turn-helix domain-containing protein [Flavobacterium sp.]|jgi:transcriptional regulator with XRE-family HTH domain|uniref:helix-turn-helix domain-containing protein n=1 Tax=Flavobacterium sp. TaxID=239 RepID=UPI0037C09DCA